MHGSGFERETSLSPVMHVTIQSVMRRLIYVLKGMGMEKAHITGYSGGAIALYSSLVAQKRTEFFIYNHKS
jgi:hypothetical protein